ncbi:MAG: hypothetical protein V4473_01360 [Patescibacteria group bacterium]
MNKRQYAFSFLSCALILCAFAQSVEAKETTLIDSDRGSLLRAMKRMGCSPQWLSPIMRESNILEVELSHLQTGRPISMPDACSEHLPSREDRKITGMVFARLNELSRVRTVDISFLNENIRLARELSEVNARVQEVISNLNQLEQKNQVLRQEVEHAKVSKSNLTWRANVFRFASGFLAGLAMWFGWWVWMRRHSKILRNKRTIVHAGIPVEYTLQALYRCLACKPADATNVSPERLEIHAIKHGELRYSSAEVVCQKVSA